MQIQKTKKSMLDTSLAEQIDYNTEKVNRHDKDFIEQGDLIRSNQNTQHTKRKPLVTFVSKGAPGSDWTTLKPLIETNGVPFTFGVVSGYYPPAVLTDVQLTYLQDGLGCEVASMTVNHLRLTEVATDEDLIDQLELSKRDLTDRGFSVRNLLYPFGEHDERVRRVAKQFYKCAIGKGAGVNTLDVLPSFALDKVDFTTGLNTRVDEVMAKNGWLIILVDTSAAGFSATNLQNLLTYILEQDVEVVTLDEGYEVFGNALEVGDYVPDKKGIAISKDGALRNFPFQPTTSVGRSVTTLLSNFPYGMSVATFVTSTGFPTSSGTLHTWHDEVDAELSHQTWRPDTSGVVYVRRWTGSAWSPFERMISFNEAVARDIFVKLGLNAFTAATTIGQFENGKVTVYHVSGAGASGFPQNAAGLVTTYRVAGNGWDRQEFQKQYSNEMWFRHVKSDGLWSEWRLASGLQVATEESLFTGMSAPSAFHNKTVTVFAVNNSTASGTPNNLGGTFTTYRTAGNGYDYQTFKEYNNFNMFVRYVKVDGTWSEWRQMQLV